MKQISNHQLGTMTVKRVLSFDVMRIVAAFSIVAQHVSGRSWVTSYPSSEWGIWNFYTSLAQWGVPVFFMISGALFLSSEKILDIRRLFSKNLLRIVYAFLFWSIVYVLVTEGFGQGLKITFLSVIKGPPHFWFLFMMIGIYLTLPVLKCIAAQEKAFNYFVVLAIITTFIIPSIFNHIGLFNELRMQALANYYDSFGLPSLYFITYFIIGHWLFSHAISSCMRKVIYLLAALSFVGSAVATRWLSCRVGFCNGFFYADLHPFILIQGIAIFVFFKDKFKSLSLQWSRIIVRLSNYSFGIYLVHPLIMYLCTNLLGFSPSAFYVAWFVPVYSVFIFVLSYLLVKLVSMVPFMRKFVM